MFELKMWKDNPIEDKINSPFWVNFIIGWMTWNWKIWYVTFFISEEKIGINKIDYISSLVTINFWIWWYLINWLLAPFIISWFVVYFISPYISYYFLKKHILNKEKDNKLKINEIKSDTKVLEAEKEKLVTKDEVEELWENKKIREWDKEYPKVVKKYPKLLSELSSLLIDYRWKSHKYIAKNSYDGYYEEAIPSESIAVWIFNLLIEEKEREPSYIVYGATEKWLYFLKKNSLEE